MTDGQLAALLAALTAIFGALGGVIKWAVGTVVSAQKESTKAIIDNTASNAVLEVKLDALAGKLDAIAEFVEDHTPIGPPPRPRIPRARTDPHGVPVGVGEYGPMKPGRGGG